MKRYLHHIVILLLVSCLITDSAFCSLSPELPQMGVRETDDLLFSQQVLGEHLVTNPERVHGDVASHVDELAADAAQDLGESKITEKDSSVPQEQVESAFAEISRIRSLPRTADKIQAMMVPGSLFRRVASQGQFIDLEDALGRIQRGEAVEDMARTAESVLWNALFYLNNRRPGINMPLARRLQGLSQAAMRIVWKTVRGRNVAYPVDESLWTEFLRLSWDAEEESMDSEVQDALLLNLESAFRKKSDFGDSPHFRSIRGRASPAQIFGLMKAVREGLLEIEGIVNVTDSETIRAITAESSLQRQETAARLLRAVPASPAELVERDADEIRQEIVAALRNLWSQGYVPYPYWLKKNRPDIYFPAMRKDIFNGMYAAYRAARLPQDIVGFYKAGPGMKQERLRHELESHPNLDLKQVTPGFLLGVLLEGDGNWVRGIQKLTGQLVSMPPLPSVAAEKAVATSDETTLNISQFKKMDPQIEQELLNALHTYNDQHPERPLRVEQIRIATQSDRHFWVQSEPNHQHIVIHQDYLRWLRDDPVLSPVNVREVSFEQCLVDTLGREAIRLSGGSDEIAQEQFPLSRLIAMGLAASELGIRPETLNFPGRYDALLDWLETNRYVSIRGNPAAAILEIGSSFGFGAMDLAHRLERWNPAWHVYGIDPGLGRQSLQWRPYGIDPVGHIGKAANIFPVPPNLTFIQDHFPFENHAKLQEPVEIILAINLFRYLSEEERRTIVNAAYDSLNEGGLLILGHGDPNYSRFRKRNGSFMVLQKLSGQMIVREFITQSLVVQPAFISNWQEWLPSAQREQVRDCFARLMAVLTTFGENESTPKSSRTSKRPYPLKHIFNAEENAAVFAEFKRQAVEVQQLPNGYYSFPIHPTAPAAPLSDTAKGGGAIAPDTPGAQAAAETRGDQLTGPTSNPFEKGRLGMTPKDGSPLSGVPPATAATTGLDAFARQIYPDLYVVPDPFMETLFGDPQAYTVPAEYEAFIRRTTQDALEMNERYKKLKSTEQTEILQRLCTPGHVVLKESLLRSWDLKSALEHEWFHRLLVRNLEYRKILEKAFNIIREKMNLHRDFARLPLTNVLPDLQAQEFWAEWFSYGTLEMLVFKVLVKRTALEEPVLQHAISFVENQLSSLIAEEVSEILAAIHFPPQESTAPAAPHTEGPPAIREGA